jgi:hypothetical protein
MARIVYASKLTWAIVEAGWWMRVAIAGVFTVVAAPLLAASGEMGPLDALVVAVGGALATALASRRAYALLGARPAPLRRLHRAAQA